MHTSCETKENRAKIIRETVTHPSNYPLKFKVICTKDYPPDWGMFHIYKAERNIFGGRLRIRVYSHTYISYNFEIDEFLEYFTDIKEEDAWDKTRHK